MDSSPESRGRLVRSICSFRLPALSRVSHPSGAPGTVISLPSMAKECTFFRGSGDDRSKYRVRDLCPGASISSKLGFCFGGSANLLIAPLPLVSADSSHHAGARDRHTSHLTSPSSGNG